MRSSRVAKWLNCTCDKIAFPWDVAPEARAANALDCLEISKVQFAVSQLVPDIRQRTFNAVVRNGRMERGSGL